MTPPPGSAGTASGSYRVEPEPRDEAAEELREALARKLSTWIIGVAYENSWLCADALLSGPLAPLLGFAAWIVSLDDDDPDSPGRIERRSVTLNEIVSRARAALDAT